MNSQASRTAVVLGASGGLGNALWSALCSDSRYRHVLAVSRAAAPTGADGWYRADATDPDALDAVAAQIRSSHPRVHLLINCVGTLQDGGALVPEKSLKDLNLDALQRLLAINAFAPLAALRAFAPLLRHDERPVAVTLSAMVGSISDNRLGGWYGYRMSKAALNMGLKNAAIELGRFARGPVVVAIHPGTTLTALSEPFVKHHKHRDAGCSATHILRVIDQLQPEDSGKFFNWDGQELAW